jgi:hypothetical protein
MANCGTCSKEFGFFNREVGCIKCNRVYCKKCLSHKIADPQNPKKTVNVCLRCFKIASDSSLAPADKTKAKVEELLEIKPEEKVPIESVLLQPTPSGEEIRNRLDALQNDDSEVPNDDDNLDDIHRRLANLKGLDYKPTANKVLFASDVRSEQEKIDDLLKQFVEEREIDGQQDITSSSEQPGSVDDIERRLAVLRGQDIEKIRAQIDMEPREETEQEEINRTVLKYIEEAKLPDFDPYEQELVSSIPPPPDGDKKSLEELPFCEICNEDAVMRCLECENLFCHRCFLEFHDEEDYKSHKTKPYQAPNKADE